MEDRSDEPHEPNRPLPQGDRVWQHPSERGLVARQDTDRRRGTRMATALVVAGAGALFAAAMVGRAGRTGPATVDASARIGPTVATIAVTDAGRTRMVTGVALDTRGDVLVRADLVVGADRLRVGCEGRTPTVARLVARDSVADLAVLRMDGRPCRAAVPDRDAQTIGQSVLAVRSDEDGAALRWRDGTVRATDTDVVRRDGTVHHRVFRTDAAGIDPRGDGLVFDRDGEFMGMVLDGPDGGQQVPVRSASALVATAAALADGQRVAHPWIGVTAEDRPVVAAASATTATPNPAPSPTPPPSSSPDPAAAPAGPTTSSAPVAIPPAGSQRSGCVVTEVDATGPAARAGLAPGDVVLDAGGTTVDSVASLARAVHTRAVGDTLVLTVRRGGATLTLRVRVADEPVA